MKRLIVLLLIILILPALCFSNLMSYNIENERIVTEGNIEILFVPQRYMVSWEVTRTVTIECPDYVPNIYTGEYPDTHCLVHHTETRVIDMYKCFENISEAYMFIDNGPSDIKFIVEDVLE